MKDQNQMPSSFAPKDHESFFQAASPEVRLRLEAIQALVERKVHGAERCVSYGMPAFRLGKVFFYFAAFKKHIGIYPPLREPDALVDELAAFRGPKGNLSFPHGEPLPLELIGRVAEALANQYGRTV
ncbi:MAG: hypothetical protein CFE27_13720 [Alphaproteobacteria bacterium PA1]|jgi:uncharacterized protein YdhG (YjbR/CyaY superfamily)|nr:MAG: hypothetical protein CFE27_13720 [Alphaproteobacteria bacterium PA1]